MAIFKCKMCGGALDISGDSSVVTCEYCGSMQTLPNKNDDAVANLFNRANHLRIKNEFDKAEEVYEKILNEDNNDAEAHWGMVLCKYGIEYVDDPASGKKVPTCHRTHYESILTDVDYLAAVANSDGESKAVYKKQAEEIANLQKDILAIVKNEKPFDVFICYKETDENGKRTVDSALANDIYYQLTQEGMKVFFAAITLEDKLGVEYEPYIFAALNSAKVMLVVGTKPEYFNAVWVRNEWARYLKLMKADRSKLLIPCYRDMDAYDLPEEFSHLQAQDMSKIGFVNDVVRGIKKVVKADEPKAETAVKETVVVNQAAGNTEALLKRAFMALEDGEFSRADDFCEQVLNIDPENAQAYLGKLMAEIKVRNQSSLRNCAQPFDGRNNYRKTVRFADDKLKKELEDTTEYIVKRNKEAELFKKYLQAESCMNSAKTSKDFAQASELFGKTPGYRDSDELAKKCKEKSKEYVEKEKEDALYKQYSDARYKMDSATSSKEFDKAGEMFRKLSGYKDADELVKICAQKSKECAEKVKEDALKRKYNSICNMLGNDDAVNLKAAKQLDEMDGYADSKEKATEIREEIYNRGKKLLNDESFSEAYKCFCHLDDYKDSKTLAEECNNRSKKKAKTKKIKSLIIVLMVTVVLAAVVALGYLMTNSSAYKAAEALANNGNKAQAAIDFYELGNFKDAKERSFELWDEIAVRETVSAGSSHVVVLKNDGTVDAIGKNDEGQCDVESWTDIIAVSAGYRHTVGLKADGTVVAVGEIFLKDIEVDYWTDIVAISAGSDSIVALKADGTVVATGDYDIDIVDWTDIVAVSAGGDHIAGLKADGTVVAVGDNRFDQCDVENWTDIVYVYAYFHHTVGVKADGTVVAVGENDFEQCNVEDWTDIIAVSAGTAHTVALRSDGTVAVARKNNPDKYGAGWTDIAAISAGDNYTIGLKSDGTLVSTRSEYDVSGISDVKLPNK